LHKQNKTIDGKSFYCGDAAGRPNDFNDTDYKFALNSDLEFHVPEQLFNVEPYETDEISASYIKILTNKKNNQFVPTKKSNELILMVGFPGSGKSKYVVENIVPCGYVRINQDTLKTKQKCLKETINAVENNLNVVIDNLNYDIDTRKSYIDIAKKNNYVVRCIIMTTSKQLSIHNMLHRTYITNGKINRIPDVVYHTMAKRYVRPSKLEKIDTIEKIHFIGPDNDTYKMFFS
jgi:bifunctional polynucleotide phosphatase/kinase